MSDEEPPPLEDMTEYLKSKGYEIPHSTPHSTPQSTPQSTSQNPPKKQTPAFKKGFLNQPRKPKPKEIPTIKPKPQKDPLVFEEVKQAMQYTTSNTQEWLTPELLQKLASHPLLAKGLTDPRFMQAVEELKTNPSLANSKYKDDHEVKAFFSEFSKVMAEHFGNVAETKQKEAQQLSDQDPQVQSVLQDKGVQKLIKAMQKGKPIDFHEVAARDPQLAAKMHFLIEKGYLKLQV